MAILLMRLEGAMQSWGLSSDFTIRDSLREPSKSGVLGIVCAALGINKDNQEDKPSINELSQLKMGVRIDRQGSFDYDFQTIRNVIKISGDHADDHLLIGKICEKNSKIKQDNANITYRYYIQDGSFLVGLEGNADLLKKIADALKNPKWFLFLGRKSYVPSKPICIKDGLIEGKSLLEVLEQYPLTLRQNEDCPETLLISIESDDGSIRNDVPVSIEKRIFTIRYIRYCSININKDMIEKDQLLCT